jgi:hypothetical protein
VGSEYKALYTMEKQQESTSLVGTIVEPSVAASEEGKGGAREIRRSHVLSRMSSQRRQMSTSCIGCEYFCVGIPVEGRGLHDVGHLLWPFFDGSRFMSFVIIIVQRIKGFGSGFVTSSPYGLCGRNLGLVQRSGLGELPQKLSLVLLATKHVAPLCGRGSWSIVVVVIHGTGRTVELCC